MVVMLKIRDQIKSLLYKNMPLLDLGFLFFILVYHCIYTYLTKSVPSEADVGYIDWVHYVRAFDDVLNGKVLHKDFYWFYGPLYLYAQIPFYVLLGGNHYAVNFLIFQILPAISIVLSYIYIRLLIKSPTYRILFLLICIFHFVNVTLASPRHLGAEIGLAVFIYSIADRNKKYSPFFVGVFVGIGLLSGSEYGVPAFLVIVVGILLAFFCKDNFLSKSYVTTFVSGLCISLAPFVIYMVCNEVMLSYLIWCFSLMQGFVENNPARGEFIPPLPSFHITGVRTFLHSLYIVFTSKGVRYFLPLVIYLVGFFVFLKIFIYQRSISCIKYFILASYGVMIYLRTLAGPAYGYFVYGLIPAITLGIYFLNFVTQQASLYFKERKRMFFSFYCFLISISIAWIFLTIENKSLLHPMSWKVYKNSNLVFYDRVGFKVSPKFRDEYERINQYIEKHTAKDDYVLEYPWGYYNHFTGRSSPLIARDGVYDMTIAARSHYDEAIRSLEDKKPKYVILNILNGGVMVSAIRTDTNAQVSWRTPDSPNFSGNGSPLEFYILENYHLVEKFQYAAILQRNKKRRDFKLKFKKTNVLPDQIKNIKVSGGKRVGRGYFFDINSRLFNLELELSESIPATHIEITYLLKTGLMKKIFTKNLLKLDVGDLKKTNTVRTIINDFSDIGQINHSFTGIAPPTKEFLRKVKTIRMSFHSPAPYFIPEKFELLDVVVAYDMKLNQGF